MSAWARSVLTWRLPVVALKQAVEVGKVVEIAVAGDIYDLSRGRFKEPAGVLEPMEVNTFWLALDDTTPENGCLRVLPKSHALNLQAMHERHDVDNVLGAEIDLESVDESKAEDTLLHPGDIEIYHPNLIHGSHVNTSPNWRRGLTIRYIPASTRILSDAPFPSAFMLRGDAVPEVNIYQPWPRYTEGEHLPFRQTDAWNQRSEAWNQRHARQLART